MNYELFDERRRDIWAAHGYAKGQASAAVTLPPKNHRYLRVYHLAPAHFALNDIALGRLKVAKISELNDPFELLSAKLHKPEIKSLAEELKSNNDKSLGLLSFSADWAAPIMWSHYADRHRGICLGFNIERSMLEKVIYVDNRLEERAEIGFANDIKLFYELLRTKSSHWNYEQEYRRFYPLSGATNEGGTYFAEFDESIQLAEVILGPNCKLSIESVRKLVRKMYPDVFICGSRLAMNSFDVVPNESTLQKS